ncbi:MAG: hypothetical protein JO116_07855 [Planctomycetaceae bacterium]|nr:hypothetical protein [Planctomycetaceae bacterium]
MLMCRERLRRQNAWRIESLEDRNLLSPVGSVAEVRTLTQHSKPAPKLVTITASFTGKAVLPSNLNQVSQFTGSGNARGIGPFTATATPSSQDISQGTFTIALKRGGSISGTYSGSATPTNKSSVYLLNLSGPITGGTKPFAGASGTFFATAKDNLKTSLISGTIKLTGSNL